MLAETSLDVSSEAVVQVSTITGEALDVKIDFSDEARECEKDSSKESTSQKAKIKVNVLGPS